MKSALSTPLFTAQRWSELRALLEQLHGLPADARTRELERKARTDPELADAARIIGQAGETSLQNSVARLLHAANGQPPATMGPFRLMQRIGAGGMGEVYLAERTGGDFSQRVALKLLDAGASSAARLAARERRILAALTHPNITAFVDAGIQHGHAWLAMEHVEGEPLLAWCDAQALDLAARVRLFDQICAAVAYAHSQLVVHRDLKPSNVLVTAAGTVKLLDFGIALALDADNGLTPATRVFTPEYAAPEQLRGEHVSTATDVYALGLMLFELVAGKRLPTVQRESGSEWTATELARYASTPVLSPDRATHADPRIVVRALRGDLGRILVHALMPDPARRYASVTLLRDDLRRWLGHRPLSIARPGFGYVAARFVRRNRAAVAIAAVAVVALLASSALALWQAHAKTVEAARALSLANRAIAMREFLTNVLDQANPDKNGGKPITPRQLIEKGERQLDRFKDKPAVLADVLTTMGKLDIGNGDYAGAQRLLGRAENLLSSPRVPDDVRSHVLAGLAELDVGNGRYAEAVAHARQSLALLKSLPDPDPQLVASAHMHIAQSLDGLGDARKTEAFLHASLAEDRARVGDKNTSVAEQWLLLGWTLRTLGRYDEALSASHHGLEDYRAVYGDDGFEVGHAWHELSLVQRAANDLRGAEASSREALRIYRRVIGPDHARTIHAESDLLGLIEMQGRVAEALPQRIALIRHAGRPGLVRSREIAVYQEMIGDDYAQLGRFSEAEAALRKSLALSEDGPANLPARRELAELFILTGRYDEAERALHRDIARELARKPPATANADTLKAWLGVLLQRRHRYAEAVTQLRGLAVFAPTLSKHDAWRPRLLSMLSGAELDAGDTAAALQTAQSARDFSQQAFARDDVRNGFALYALGRAQLAAGRSTEALASLHEALRLRQSTHPPTHPFVLEVETALVRALLATGQRNAAHVLAAQIAPVLARDHSPYAQDLRQSLPRDV